MNQKDASTITAMGVLAAAFTAALASFGVAVPLYIPAAVPIVTACTLMCLRAYIAYVGADNTQADEHLAQAQDLIEHARGMTSFATSEAPTRRDRRP